MRRLEAAIRLGGFVLVIAETRHKATAFADNVVGGLDPLAVLRISARAADPGSVIDTIDDRPPDAQPALDRSEVLARALARARGSGKRVVAVVDDVEFAGAERTRRLRSILVCPAEYRQWLSIVVVGSPRLDRMLGRFAARAMFGRVRARIRLRSRGRENAHPGRPRAVTMAVSALCAAAIAAVLIASPASLTPQWGAASAGGFRAVAERVLASIEQAASARGWRATAARERAGFVSAETSAATRADSVAPPEVLASSTVRGSKAAASAAPKADTVEAGAPLDSATVLRGWTAKPSGARSRGERD